METSKIKKDESKTTYFFFYILSLSKWNEMYFSSIQNLEKIIGKGSFT